VGHPPLGGVAQGLPGTKGLTLTGVTGVSQDSFLNSITGSGSEPITLNLSGGAVESESLDLAGPVGYRKAIGDITVFIGAYVYSCKYIGR